MERFPSRAHLLGGAILGLGGVEGLFFVWLVFYAIVYIPAHANAVAQANGASGHVVRTLSGTMAAVGFVHLMVAGVFMWCGWQIWQLTNRAFAGLCLWATVRLIVALVALWMVISFHLELRDTTRDSFVPLPHSGIFDEVVFTITAVSLICGVGAPLVALVTIRIATRVPHTWRRKQRQSICPRCGYNMRGSRTPVCPECGFPAARCED